MTPDLALAIFMLGSIAGLLLAHFIERLIERHERAKRLECDTDALRALSMAEIDELLSRKPYVIQPADFQVVEKPGVPLHWERL